MKEFGEKNYSDTAYFNFEEDDISRFFEKDLKVDRIIKSLGIYRSAPISEETLIIFDEIQNCPRALSSLKYFCEHGGYDVMCAGSLLGVKLSESSPPVGKVDEITMYPMSFREFVIANGQRMLVDMIDCDPLDPSMDGLSDRLIDLYHEYVAVGGLPGVVSSWVEYHDPERIDMMLRSLKSGYIDDISRYGKGKVKENGEHVWNSLPSQLSKDNNKFVLGHVREGQRARDLWSSIDWLSKAGLIHLVPISVGHESVPSFDADPSSFKLYCFDTGILRILADLPVSSILDDRGGHDLFRGACTENYVLLELRKMNDFGIFCWRSGNRAEVDFLFNMDGAMIPIEVKSGKRIHAKSLGVYLDTHDGSGVIVSMNPPMVKGRVVFVPLYMMWPMKKYLIHGQ